MPVVTTTRVASRLTLISDGPITHAVGTHLNDGLDCLLFIRVGNRFLRIVRVNHQTVQGLATHQPTVVLV
jgi:hypothetical protein